ncbi:unnamed protein product [Adineta steineri]|uniref:LamG-like jellyroll fold domain-containing protein n=1 Tax=Adineta steineri TaxID=433720 RepID=A0A816FHV2_9BILA|nr:unnamed protein product [Adineta steineri]CAF1661735.1 unnamed protein product [Adineta steineri]
MNTVKTVGNDVRTRIAFVPRQARTNVQKIKVFDKQEQLPSITNISELPSFSSKNITPNETTEQNSHESSSKPKTDRLPSSNAVQSVSPPTESTCNLKTVKDLSGHGFKNWLSRLTPKQKLLLKIIIPAIIISSIVLIIILPVYFYVINPHLESSFANITVSACSKTTCIGKETPYHTSITTALYPFDGNYNDIIGYNTGIPTNSPTFSVSYPGYVSQAVYFTSGSQQFIQIPNINLTKQSFTLQAWLWPTTMSSTNDLAIFGQCDSNSRCLSLSIRSARFALSFDSMNTSSIVLMGTSVVQNSWVHVTVVYDITLFQQRIYVNGRIDAVSNNIVNPFQTISSVSATTIAKTSSSAYGTSYYSGKIDHLTISAGIVRTTCQILNDASLVAYYPFNTTTATWNDYSVNLCNGIASGVTLSEGRVDQAISFQSSTSYFQAQCFPKMRYTDTSFSISLWINPTSLTSGGSLVHISTNTTGTLYCYDLLAFTTTGALVLQWMVSVSTVNSVLGPVMPLNTWTHIAVVFSTTNGIRLFINGEFSTSSANTGSLTIYDPTMVQYITLGNVGSLGPASWITCATGSISYASGPFSGAVDEFRLYNRELDSQEICVLANP